MSLFESMSRDLGTVQRVNIQEVRMNIKMMLSTV